MQLNEDAISRKSIKQKLQEHHDFFVNAYGGFSNLPRNDKSRVDEIINCIAMVTNEPPIVTAEPKTGHWIDEVTIIGAKICRCSECSFTIPKPLIKNNFCPNCGARMESEES